MLVDLNKAKNVPDKELVVITTGSQGEPMSALARMASSDHKAIKIKPGDMVILSSSPVPGNELTVSNVVNQLVEKGAEVIYSDIADTHVSGHACQEELKLMHSLIRPKFFMPVHGLTNGSQPVMGYNYGAGAGDRVRQCIRFLTVVCLVYTAAIWLCVVLFPSFWIHLFNSDPVLLADGVPALQLYFFGFVMMAFQFAGQAAFTSLGKARQAVFFSLFRKIVIVVPLTIALPYVGGLGVNGVFLAEPISNFVGGLACYVTMYVTVYRKLGKTERITGEKR